MVSEDTVGKKKKIEKKQFPGTKWIFASLRSTKMQERKKEKRKKEKKIDRKKKKKKSSRVKAVNNGWSKKLALCSK